MKIKEALAALHRDSLKPEVFIIYDVLPPYLDNFSSGEQLRPQKCDKMHEIEVFADEQRCPKNCIFLQIINRDVVVIRYISSGLKSVFNQIKRRRL